MYDITSELLKLPLQVRERNIIKLAERSDDRLCLITICKLMDAQTREINRQRLFVHFEKTVPWRLKELVGMLHELHNEYPLVEQPRVRSPRRAASGELAQAGV